jgi:hypothetical protein
VRSVGEVFIHVAADNYFAAANLAAQVAAETGIISTYFGPKRPTTVRRAWVGATTHLHEHLGQLIAYARSNKIVPPWSK